MYHLIIENLGVKRCIATSESDDFREDMYIDCRQDHGCIPENHIRDLRVICAGNQPKTITASVFKD